MANYTPKTLVLSKDGNTYTYNVDFSGKLDANQGSANAGKVMQVGSDGSLSPQKIEASGTYYGTSATAATTQQKAVTLVGDPPSELKEGMVFIIKFTTAHSYNGKPTLKIGDFAAVTVNNGYRYMWNANSTIVFVYTNSVFEAQTDAAASTTYYGITKLTSATNSTSEALAASAKGVKLAYDEAVKVMTGAGSTNGAAGRVPAPSAGDQDKVLTGAGVWAEQAGSRLMVVTLDDVTNTSGSYTHTTTVSGMTGDLKAVKLECSDPTIFRAPVSIVTGSGSVTLTCSNVAGSSTVKASFLAVGNGNPLSSTEYGALDTRIGQLADLETTDKTDIVSAINENTEVIETLTPEFKDLNSCIISSVRSASVFRISKTGKVVNAILKIGDGSKKFSEDEVIITGIPQKYRPKYSIWAPGVILQYPVVMQFNTSGDVSVYIIRGNATTAASNIYCLASWIVE